MATSQMGRGLTLKPQEGLRPAFPTNRSMALSSVSLRRFSCNMYSVRDASSVAFRFSTLKPLGDRVWTKLKQTKVENQGGNLLPATSHKSTNGGEATADVDVKPVGKTQFLLPVPHEGRAALAQISQVSVLKPCIVMHQIFVKGLDDRTKRLPASASHLAAFDPKDRLLDWIKVTSQLQRGRDGCYP